MIIYLQICEVNYEYQKKQCKPQYIYIYILSREEVWAFLMLFYSPLLCYIYIYIILWYCNFFLNNFLTWTTKLSLVIFYKIKKLTTIEIYGYCYCICLCFIWKYVNFLDRKLIYDILRGGMAFIISTWAPTQYFLVWATCW